MMSPQSISTAVATAPFSSAHAIDGHVVKMPVPPVHGKEMGTTITLCGKSALSWNKFLTLPFETLEGERCPRCASAAEAPPKSMGRRV